MSLETLSRIENKVDKLDTRMDRMDVHFAVYNEQLGAHMKRTDLLEKAVEPVVVVMKGIKFMTWIGGVVSGLVGFYFLIRGIL